LISGQHGQHLFGYTGEARLFREEILSSPLVFHLYLAPRSDTDRQIHIETGVLLDVLVIIHLSAIVQGQCLNIFLGHHAEAFLAASAKAAAVARSSLTAMR